MRRSIGLLIISGLLPTIALGGAFGVLLLRAQHEEVRTGAETAARFTAALASAKLRDGMAAVDMITQSPAFDGPLDAARFRTLALRIRTSQSAWRILSVADASGRRLIDVPVPIGGTPGGPVVDKASLDQAVASRRPIVGNVMRGPRGGFAFAIRAPVIRMGQVRYVVSAIVATDAVSPLLRFRALPPGWRAGVVDGAGNIVASSGANSTVIGQRVSVSGLRSRNGNGLTFYEFKRRDGSDAVGTWAPIEGTNWSASISAPASAFSEPVRHALILLAFAGLACLLLLALLVRLLSRELAQYRAREIAEIQSQRMEALGRLTGGVAHDFNNLLTPILGGLDLVRRRVGDDPRLLRQVDAAIASADRARALVSRLLSFARRQTLSQTDIDLGQMLDELRELLGQAAGATNRIEIEVLPGVPIIHADRTQLELAILNLAINARDAMPDGGRIRVTASAVTIGQDQELPPGRYAAVAVADEGIGMDQETLRRAIDPFFTTKAADKGTGLGLSMVHGFAAQSGGALRIESKPGEGTIATILLPAGARATPSREQAAAAVSSGAGRLLLVDDEDAVRAATAAMLIDAGHTPIEASSVDEALRLLRDRRDVDAVLTDYVMPGRSGADLIRELRRDRPDMPVLLITGFADAAHDIPSDVPRLAKPYRGAELVEAVNRLLSRA